MEHMATVINSHTHIYPDKIAAAAERDMSHPGAPPLPPGCLTLKALLADMEQHGIAASVVLCVAQQARQVRSANDFAIQINDNRRIIALGSIHPEFEGYKEEVARLRANGIKGIKFHAVIQHFNIDDPHMMAVYQEMGEDMIAYFHMGLISSEPGSLGATPDRLARVLTTFPKLKVVAAHLGGMEMLDQVEQHLIGRNLYIDTSYSPSVRVVNRKWVLRLVQEHGAHRVLFATDYPAVTTPGELEWVRGLPLKEQDMELVLSQNARKLFGINLASKK